MLIHNGMRAKLARFDSFCLQAQLRKPLEENFLQLARDNPGSHLASIGASVLNSEAATSL